MKRKKGSFVGMNTILSRVGAVSAKALLVAMMLVLGACAVEPTRENYLRAIDRGDIDTLQKLEASGFKSIQGFDTANSTFPIHYAVTNKKLQLLPYFIDWGHDLNQLDDHGKTPLMVATSAGDEEAVKQLLELGANPNRLGASGESALALAPAEHTHIAETLLRARANPAARNKAGKSVLQQVHDRPKIAFAIEEALKREQAFLNAIQEGDLAEVEAFIDEGYWVNIQNESGTSAVHFSVLANQLSALEVLLAAKADPNLVDSVGATPLMYAVDAGKKPLVNGLLAAKANLNLASNDGWTALHLTVNNAYKIEENYIDIARLLVTAGADINAQKNDDGSTPLHMAISNLMPNIALLLIEAGANINARSNDGSTPLGLGPPQRVTEALLAAKADPNLANNNGTTPLMSAAHNGNTAMVKTLLAAKADPNRKNTKGSTALHFAATIPRISEENYADIMRLLVAAGANINAQSNRGTTPLMDAVFVGNITLVKALLASKADPNLADNGGWTALHSMVNGLIAKVEYDHADIVRVMVAAGANINAKSNYGHTPLLDAVYSGDIASVKALLAAKADPNLADGEGFTPLSIAVNKGNIDLVEALLAAKANPNLSNEDGWTALHLTVNNSNKPEHDYADIARLLIAAGADINARKNDGSTPLNLAILNQKPNTVAALLAAKADPNLASTSGWTPLMSAVNTGNIDLVKALLTAKANPNLSSEDGWTPLHLTVNNPDNPEHDYVDIARLLLREGARTDSRTKSGVTPLMVAAMNGKVHTAKVLIEGRADLSLINWQEENRSALDYAVNRGHHQIADMLRGAGAISGIEEARYPPPPAKQTGATTCNTRCYNGDCYRTYSDGRKINFQAPRKFNPHSRQWEWDSGGC